MPPPPLPPSPSVSPQLGGVLIHQVRRRPVNCTAAFGFQNECFADVDLDPFGIDPIFSPESSWHDPTVNVSAFYNVRTEVNEAGVPFGFFPLELEGFPSGFPVFVPTQVSGRHAQSLMEYLAEGRFVDEQTSVLTVEMVSFNSDLNSLFYTTVNVRFSLEEGVVDVKGRTYAVPVPATRDPVLMGLSLVLTALNASVAALALRAIVSSLRGHGRSWRRLRRRKRLANVLAFGFSLSLVGAMVIWWTFFGAGMSLALQPSYELLESPSGDQPRFLLLKRADRAAYVPKMTDLLFRDPKEPPLWRRPADLTDVNAFARALAAVRAMTVLLNAYWLVQAFNVAAVVLVFNMKIAAYNARIGLATRAVVMEGRALVDFVVVATVVLTNLGFLVLIVFGCETGPACRPRAEEHTRTHGPRLSFLPPQEQRRANAPPERRNPAAAAALCLSPFNRFPTPAGSTSPPGGRAPSSPCATRWSTL